MSDVRDKRLCEALRPHAFDPAAKKPGPPPQNLLGGNVAGFKYSKAMREVGLVWKVETLDSYLQIQRNWSKARTWYFPASSAPRSAPI